MRWRPHPGLVARLLRQQRERTAQASERIALTKLGYATPTLIEPSPQHPPVKQTTPRGIAPVGGRHERVFDEQSIR